MKKTILLFCLLAFNLFVQVKAQTFDLHFYLLDEQTQLGVDGVHVFLSNTTFGTVSDEKGFIQLAIPSSMEEELIVSHISYDSRVFSADQYKKIQQGDTIWLRSNHLNIAEIVVSDKRSGKWKKNFKKFQHAFLGQDEAANKCEILNPEVLRFQEESGSLTVTAIDLLNIRNDYLGYDIQYLLKGLTIEADGSTAYLGQAIFKDISNKEKRLQKNRTETYLRSPKHFFLSLLNDQLEENGYDIAIETYRNGQFIPLMAINAAGLVKKTSKENLYHIQFNEFLKVTHKGDASISYSKIGVRSGGLESQKFSGSRAESKANIQYPISYLYKITPSLEVNQFGNVLNSKMVKEYGFWAEQRFARQLPFDYGNDYQLEKKKVEEVPLTNQPIAAKVSESKTPDPLVFFKKLAFDTDRSAQQEILEQINASWQEEYIPALVEIVGWSRNSWLNTAIRQLLAKQTEESVEKGYYEWLQWLWERPVMYGAYYADLKAELYAKIDPRFYNYFKNRQETAQIRLDEIVWGGVKQDGIPPLRNPKMITASEATYLADDNIIFGFYINGMARAYPKRILAWHEFFTDNFGDLEIAGVYCTLCGTVIAYDRTAQNTLHHLGTSGFLYRSNKLMYDKATQSLWNTIEGIPVVGTLANENIQLQTYPLVTTTWGAWKKAHPNTKVLSLETGHQRNYGEGEAYKDYFSTDRLMFPVPEIDSKLPNKAEVLVVRAEGYKNDPLAIDIDYLKRKKWHQDKIADTNILVLADKTGTARVYAIGNTQFASYKKGALRDKDGDSWKITEDALLLGDRKLQRLPAHRIFWFAWFNTYPTTRLIK